MTVCVEPWGFVDTTVETVTRSDVIAGASVLEKTDEVATGIELVVGATLENSEVVVGIDEKEEVVGTKTELLLGINTDEEVVGTSVVGTEVGLLLAIALEVVVGMKTEELDVGATV